MSSKLLTEILLPEELLSIVGLVLRPNEVVVDVAAWEDPIKRGSLHFAASKFRSFCVNYSDEDFAEEPDYLDFPWDPIGFDSEPSITECGTSPFALKCWNCPLTLNGHHLTNYKPDILREHLCEKS